MDYEPPLAERNTEQLLSIINEKEKWNEEVVLMAHTELEKRGIPLAQQLRQRSIFRRYKIKSRNLKANASYSPKQKALIVLFGPILLVLALFPIWIGDGYQTKSRQNLFYLVLGLALWILLIFLLN